MVTFEPGRVLTQYGWFGGAVFSVVPVRVVEHTPAGLLLWMARGTPMWLAELPPGRHGRDIPRAQWPAGGFPLRPDGRFPVDQLVYQPDGSAYSLWIQFDDGGRFRNWYVNLESRRRDGDDLHINDQELDIVVTPDLAWRWKDEESFAAKTGDPLFWTAQEAAAVRAEGEAVIKLIEKGEFPFDGAWTDFQPPAGWDLPELPGPDLPGLPSSTG